jgi:hypothetical protein
MSGAEFSLFQPYTNSEELSQMNERVVKFPGSFCSIDLLYQSQTNSFS